MNNEYVFCSRTEFRNWLIKNNMSSEGIWLVLSKDKKINTLSAIEALEEALCFGWIDGKIKRIDDTKYIKYFAPRKKESKWSEKNKKIVQELIEKGLVTQPGLDAINVAKSNGYWDTKQNPINYEKLIQRFATMLKEDNFALYEKFMSIPSSYKKQIVGFYYNAKQETTKLKRYNKIIKVLQEGKRGILY